METRFIRRFGDFKVARIQYQYYLGVGGRMFQKLVLQRVSIMLRFCNGLPLHGYQMYATKPHCMIN